MRNIMTEPQITEPARQGRRAVSDYRQRRAKTASTFQLKLAGPLQGFVNHSGRDRSAKRAAPAIAYDSVTFFRVDLRLRWDRCGLIASSNRRFWSVAFVSFFNAIWRWIASLGHAGADRQPLAVAAARATPYDALAEATGDLVLRHDASGSVLSVSGGAEAAFGVEGDELIGRGFFERVQVGDRPAFLQAIDDALRRDGTICVTLRLRTGPKAEPRAHFGEPVFTHVEMRIRRFAGDPTGAVVVSVVRNVAAPEDRNETIEAASMETENVNSWKDRLLANVSHELRTPLNAIIGFSEILGSAELAPRELAKQLEYAGIIHASAEHLLSVVNLILDISKLEAGRFTIIPESFDVAPVIAACCDMLRLKAEEGGLALVRAPMNCPSELTADKRACRQIIINLLSNAVKFTKPGGSVTIGASVEDDSLLITVEDTGIGIAPAQFAKLGDPFFQVRSSYDRMFEGTGLGLSLVRGLVGLHGGSLVLESAVEIGTRVTVRLPLDCRGKAPSDAPPAPIETVSRLAPAAPIACIPTAPPATLLDVTKEKKIA
jgi:two-component system, cell cycle sensor histidine kinase DivJ